MTGFLVMGKLSADSYSGDWIFFLSLGLDGSVWYTLRLSQLNASLGQ